jgi:hypothetical protein
MIASERQRLKSPSWLIAARYRGEGEDAGALETSRMGSAVTTLSSIGRATTTEPIDAETRRER